MNVGPIVDVVEDESDQRDTKVSMFIEDGRQAANERDIACTSEWIGACIRQSLPHPHRKEHEFLLC